MEGGLGSDNSPFLPRFVLWAPTEKKHELVVSFETHENYYCRVFVCASTKQT